uniref:EGF-like domain-containing protein n=1 Tax=Gasterosteus aculeatus aculeatus TaxID=481459 RepID=A0AAQ4QDY4_GASAC
CVTVCDCAHGVCSNGPEGDGQCLCQPPYSGTRCDQGETQRDEVTSGVCGRGSKKKSPSLLWTEWDLCFSSSGICAARDCDVNAQCSSQGSRVTCACKPDYLGDGRVCVPRNPCSENNGGCPVNSTVCVFKGPNESQCRCMFGMSPVGGSAAFGCELVSACSADTCDATAVCHTEADGQHRCVCEAGQIGDGHRCYGNLMERLIELDRSGSQRESLTGSVAMFGKINTRSPSATGVQESSPVTLLDPPKWCRSRLKDTSTPVPPAFFLQGEILLGEKGVRLASTNIVASNGIIHMIDGLLYPPSILPILPHRCDVINSEVIVGPCTCPLCHGVESVCLQDRHQVGCDYVTSPLRPTLSRGCAKFCNATKRVPQCCEGFYGPDCKPCIGGFQHPCYDKGTCFDGMEGEGSCKKCDEVCRCMHGVCDNRPGSGGVCRRGSCAEGFSGENCDKAATPCNSDGLEAHCHVHAYCTHSGLQTTCLCRDGYDGDGHSCSAINPCLKSGRGGCHLNAECVYVAPGNASCVCMEGWTGDGRVCVELNNCQLEGRGGCSPNADCNHIGPGQSECVCKTGYMGDGVVCDLVNPCMKKNGGCHDMAKCQPSEGGGTHTCTCPDGFAGDGTICFGSILQVRDADVFKYHVILNELLFPDHLSDGALKSTLLGADYQVQFHLNHNNQVTTAAHARNALPLTQFSHTSQMFSTKNPKRREMINLLLFIKRDSSVEPRIEYDYLHDHSCCPGYYGHECFKCPGGIGSWCSNHGECQDGNLGNGECRCFEGFHGTACEDCEPGRYGATCSSKCACDHGKCEDGLAGSGRCVCYKGWRGSSCSIEIKDDACGGGCDENGNCVTGPKGTAAACVCVAGYEGNGTYCTELDLCSRSNGGCSEFAVCLKVSAGERTCTCGEGYTGDGVIDGCLVQNGGCHESADCIRTGPNTTACNCQTGFQGSGRFCYPVNPCHRKNGGCSLYARCEYLGHGQRNCSCLRGHVGDGFDCRGTTNNVSHMSFEEWDQSGRLSELVRYHILSCETLTLSDLKTTKVAVATSGHTLHFSLREVTHTHTHTHTHTCIFNL